MSFNFGRHHLYSADVKNAIRSINSINAANPINSTDNLLGPKRGLTKTGVSVK